MHHVLERQIRKTFGENAIIPQEWNALLKLISDTYAHFDEDRELLHRSLDLSSKEFLEINKNIEKTKFEVAERAKNLAIEVSKQTKELSLRIKELEDARSAMTNLLKDFEVERIRSNVLAKDLEKFKLAVDNASDQVLITDREGTVIYVNPAVEKNTGYSSGEIMNKKAGALWKTPMPHEYYQKMWDTIEKQKKVFHGEIKNKRKNGEAYTTAISISPVLNEFGDIEFFVGIEHDITREKEIERSKNEFISIASHELRAPLGIIKSFISLILEGDYGAVNPKLTQPLRDIFTSTERIISLVNDMLNVSRMEAGRMLFKLSEFPIDIFIHQIALDFTEFAKKAGTTIEVKNTPASTQGNPAAGDRNIIQVDQDKVREILGNLIGNAIKFTEQGTVTVYTKRVGEFIFVFIADTGVGIGYEDQKKIFGKFQQAGSVERGKPQGTGLGLYICKTLAEKMGGQVWLESSSKGAGSVFGVSFPLAGTATAQKARQAIEQEAKLDTTASGIVKH